jgi:hypothetical protein
MKLIKYLSSKHAMVVKGFDNQMLQNYIAIKWYPNMLETEMQEIMEIINKENQDEKI